MVKVGEEEEEERGLKTGRKERKKKNWGKEPAEKDEQGKT